MWERWRGYDKNLFIIEHRISLEHEIERLLLLDVRSLTHDEKTSGFFHDGHIMVAHHLRQFILPGKKWNVVMRSFHSKITG